MGRCAWWVTIAICFKALAALQTNQTNVTTTEPPVVPFDTNVTSTEPPVVPFDVADLEVDAEGDNTEYTEEKMNLFRDFMETNPAEVDGQPVLEGDMVLTHSQMRAIKERKAIRFSSYRWPGAIVPYVFGDSRVVKSAVLAGIQHWQQHTCLTFYQTSATRQPHLRFISGSGCYSYIGRRTMNGQPVSIGPGCTSLNTVVHEIGHAIGFFHEQSRPDRDSYVIINTANIISSKLFNFYKYPSTIINTYGIIYDYTSVMHYTSTAFTANGSTTIATRNPLYQPLIARQNGLTFRDKQLANLMYGCLDQWLFKCGMCRNPCKYGGYIGKDCTCVCPPGTMGCRCEKYRGNYYSNIDNSCSQFLYYRRVTVSSPSYPRNYPSGQCVKWIYAPRCYVPVITFTEFSMYPKRPYCNGNLCCYFDALEIRTTNRYTGAVYCGNDISPGQNITSTTREIVVYHRARTHNWFKGWSFQISFIKSGC